MLSASTSTIAENDNVLNYCVKYMKQYLTTSEVPKFNNDSIIHFINYCTCNIASDGHQFLKSFLSV